MSDEMTSEQRDDNGSDSLWCGECGSKDVGTDWALDTIIYGEGPDAPKISVQIPFRTCRQCGFRFIDAEAEDFQHDAVCRHLGVLAPKEILGIRNQYGMNRLEFARLTGLGEATLGRWERGALIQNTALDRYLRLLAIRENVDRVRAYAASGGVPPPLTHDRERTPKSAELSMSID